MILLDANVLIYAFRRDADRHEEFRSWLENALASERLFCAPDLVLSAVVKITTHPRVFAKPSSLDEAFRFVNYVRALPNAVRVQPGARHWEIFSGLCRKSESRGNLVTDAFLAALAIESGAEWVTTDRDFARFPGLAWRHPLDSPS